MLYHQYIKHVVFCRASFLEGIARSLDIMSVMDNATPELNPNRADYLALERDWKAVGDDLRLAMEKVAAEISEKKLVSLK